MYSNSQIPSAAGTNTALNTGVAGYSGVFGFRAHAVLSSQEQDIINVAWEAFAEAPKGSGKDNEPQPVPVLSKDRLDKAFKEIGAENEIKDIQVLIDDMDTNGDGTVDEYEFQHIMQLKFLGEDDDDAFVHGFELLDENKDGYIPLVEFRHMLMKQGQSPLTEQEVDELLMFADPTADGLIDYRVFLRWLAAPPEPDRKKLLTLPPAQQASAPSAKAPPPTAPGV